MNSGQYPERVASKCNHAGKRPTRLCIESRSYKIFLSHESKVKCNTESKAASPKYLLLLLLHLKTTENSRIWKYDTRRALRIGLQLCINKQQPRVNACEEKAKGTPIPALGASTESPQSPGPLGYRRTKKSKCT